MTQLATLAPNRKQPAAAAPPAPGMSVRGLVHLAVGLAIAGLVSETWLLGGVLVPAAVSGGSMAPTLLGDHHLWHCDGCGEPFVCNRESLPPAGRDAVCPFCGERHALAEARSVAGVRLLVNRAVLARRRPRRWETVVLRLPDEPRQLGVKRVVGLPGELISLGAGDLLVNGRRVAKPREVQAQLAVAIAPSTLAPACWQSREGGSWVWRNEQWQHSAGRAGHIDWLDYRHREPVVRAADEGPPVLDGSFFDQSESRRLNPVGDLILRCQINGERGEFHLQAGWHGQRFSLALPLAGGQARLLQNDAQVVVAPCHGIRGWQAIELALADGRLRLHVGSITVLEYEIEPSGESEPGAGPLLAIGADGPLAVAGLEVRRDVYYTAGPQGDTQYQLGPDEYFLLGDNSAHSLDSRHWRKVVRSGMILGSALSWQGDR